MPVQHATIEVEQLVRADVGSVWSAYADPVTRARWSVPAGEAMSIDHDDLRDGGAGRYRCGEPGVLPFTGVVGYVRVVPGKLVVQTETVHAGDELLASALVTWRFRAHEDQTLVSIVDQVTSFVGEGMIEGHRNGHRLALEQLAQHLAG